MAIRIVDDTPHISVIKQIICRSCGVTLEYAPIDIKERHGTDIGGGPDGAQYINCPKCQHEVIIKRW